MDRRETNELLRGTFNTILNHEPDKRELELIEAAQKEEQEYLQKKEKFYNNPLHWSNNKRRRNGLPVLRGSVNQKDRCHFPSFHPTAFLFGIIEDIIDDTLNNDLSNEQFFNQFVDYKDLDLDGCDVVYYEKGN